MAELEVTKSGHTEVAQLQPTRGETRFSPLVDIVETETELVLQAEIPGVKPGDVDLSYEKGELTLSGRVPVLETGRKYLVHEYEQGDFVRTFRIHKSIDTTKIQAEHKNGLLTVHLPKLDSVQPRKITIKAQ